MPKPSSQCGIAKQWQCYCYVTDDWKGYSQDKLTEALDWVRESDLPVNDPPDYLREYEHLTLARVLIAQSDGTDELIDQTIGLLTHLLAAVEAKKRTGSIIKILLVLVLANEVQGDVAAAIAFLERALRLAEPEGYVCIFAECGTPVSQLFQAASGRSTTPTYQHRLLLASETWGLPLAIASSSQPLIEPLSQRELEVVRLLDTELSGPEITRELVVALSTVRTHAKRIYGKLSVTNRRAAIKRTTELDLIWRLFMVDCSWSD